MNKTIFKNPFNYLILCGVLCLALGCNKQIDRSPITSYSSTNFWNEPAQASAALAGAYTYMQSAFGSEFIYYGESRSDNLVLQLENNSNAIDVINNTLSPNMSLADWGNFYRVIKQANLIIRNVALMKDKNIYSVDGGNINDYNRVIGQAYGLRAFCYFYIVRIWGDVPLIVDPIKSDGDIVSYQTPRTDTTLIYKQIENDLDSAHNLLPSSYSGQQNQANLTRGGIDAIFTDYYMWRNNMDSALAYSANVLNNSNYKLVQLYDSTSTTNYFLTPNLIDNTDYAKMFYQGFSPESIFEIAYNYQENSGSGLLGLYGYAFQSQFVASDSMLNKFDDPNDLRPIVDFAQDIQIRKFYEKNGFDKTKENDKNIILYRLADIMLLRAEALNAVGRRDEAFALVNQIRQRAGAAPITNIDYNAFTISEAEDYILDERDRELCFEGKRWFDLVRTGRAIPTMKPINGLSDPANILWPISLDVIRENPTIEQNSYYK